MFFKWNQFFPGSIRLPANINLYDDLEDEDLLDLDEYVEYDDIEDNLGESARYLRQSAGPNTHYVQVNPYGGSGIFYAYVTYTHLSKGTGATLCAHIFYCQWHPWKGVWTVIRKSFIFHQSYIDNP